MNRIVLWSSIVVLAASCGGPSAPPPNIVRIGVLLARTGSTATEPSWEDAIALAEATMNQALRDSGYKNMQFEVVISDDEDTEAVAVARAVELVQTQGVAGIVTGASDTTIAVNRTFYDMDATNDLNVPLLSGQGTSSAINNPTFTSATDPILEAANRNLQGWMFRGTMSLEAHSLVMVRHLLARTAAGDGDVNGDGTLKITLYANNNSRGRSANTEVRAALPTLAPAGTPIVVETVWMDRNAPGTYVFGPDVDLLLDNQTTTMDATTLMTTGTVVDVVPDIILAVISSSFITPFVQAYRARPSLPYLLHSQSIRNSSVLTTLGSGANGERGVSPELLYGTYGAAFAARYNATYGVDVVRSDAQYFDSTMMLMLATVLAVRDLADPTAVTGVQVRDALRRLAPYFNPSTEIVGPLDAARAIDLVRQGTPINYEGAGGPLDFDVDQRVRMNLALFEIQNRLGVDLEKYGCIAGPECLPCPGLVCP